LNYKKQKTMKQIIIGLGIIAITITACTKKRTSVAGFWTGTLTAPASEGGATIKDAYKINSNGTMVYYSLKASGDTTSPNWRGVGTWTVSGSNITITFTDPTSNHGYVSNGIVNSKFTTMTGTFKIDVVNDAYTFAASVE
jgi:Lipocalin-like domain